MWLFSSLAYVKLVLKKVYPLHINYKFVFEIDAQLGVIVFNDNVLANFWVLN